MSSSFHLADEEQSSTRSKESTLESAHLIDKSVDPKFNAGAEFGHKIQEVGDAQRSKTIHFKRWLRCSWLPEVPGEYPASLDKKCTWFAQAHRAGDCRGLPFSQTSADQETTG
jgi:hypothetical protein